MVKSVDQVIHDFNEIVNMTADELDTFLKTEASESTGWNKDDGSGESIGHESGRKIVDILRRNPSKDPSKYTEEDTDHMRRVVSYCKRHLAQESHLKETKGHEELEKSKSTRSLKNWGHDPMKTVKKPTSKKHEKPVSKADEETESKKADKPESNNTIKPVSNKSEKPVSKKQEKENKKEEEKKKEEKIDEKKDSIKSKKTESEAQIGEKREASGGKGDQESEVPPKKPAKNAKSSNEGIRKLPSRSVKKT